jgi:digalactosyldiacylglycerol synthase
MTSKEVEEEEEALSVASPVIAVEVDEEGDIRLEDHPDDGLSNDAFMEKDSDHAIVPASDLSDTSKSIYIITTAALPWRTGTAVNPLLRALYLAKDRETPVTLMVPWLGKAAAKTLYGTDHAFETSVEQEKWIRQYCLDRCDCPQEVVDRLRIEFWNGAYNEAMGSIFPIEDICSKVAKTADVCILEEPEHLNWFRVPVDPESDLGWKAKFPHVVGILHTNYGDYARQYGMGFSAPALNSLSALVVRAYCHRVIRLSATLPHLDPSKEVTVNVHGVRAEFLADPKKPDVEAGEDAPVTAAAVYFIGKLVWAKGFENVLELQEKFKIATGKYFPIDVYGGGKDEKEIQKACFGRKNMRSKSSDGDSKRAAVVFDSPTALQDAIALEEQKAIEDVTSHSESSQGDTESSDVLDTAVSFPDDEKQSCDAAMAEAAMDCVQSEVGVPLDIFAEISGKTFSTSVDTAEAALKLIDSVVLGGFSDDKPRRSLFSIAPAKTRFKVHAHHFDMDTSCFLTISHISVASTWPPRSLSRS